MVAFFFLSAFLPDRMFISQISIGRRRIVFKVLRIGNCPMRIGVMSARLESGSNWACVPVSPRIVFIITKPFEPFGQCRHVIQRTHGVNCRVCFQHLLSKLLQVAQLSCVTHGSQCSFRFPAFCVSCIALKDLAGGMLFLSHASLSTVSDAVAPQFPFLHMKVHCFECP